MNIINIHQLIDLVQDFMSSDWNLNHILTVGGMCGTSTFKNTINAVITTMNFDQILIIEGCQDSIELSRDSIPNYRYYQSLFYAFPEPDLDYQLHPNKLRVFDQVIGYHLEPLPNALSSHTVCIINNAHLIPDLYLNLIEKIFSGKIIEIVDPFEVGCERFGYVHTVCDSLVTQNMNIAFARSLFGIGTRMIEKKKARFKVDSMKMRRSSIGRLDDKQYVTLNDDLLHIAHEKQKHLMFRKNMRFIVKQQRIDHIPCNDRTIIIGKDSILHVTNVPMNSYMIRVRLHMSTNQFMTRIFYIENYKDTFVEPANVLRLEDVRKHRFNHLVLMTNGETLDSRQWYTLLKISDHLSIVQF